MCNPLLWIAAHTRRIDSDRLAGLLGIGQLHLDLAGNGVDAAQDEAVYSAYHRPMVPVAVRGPAFPPGTGL